MLYFGLDSGTQSTKCVVLDLETGEIIASAASKPHGFVENLPAGHLEQHPDAWVNAAGETIEACLNKIGSRRSEIRGIGVSGQQHGLVALNEKGRPVRPAKLWCDTSTQSQCDAITEEFGGTEALVERIGNAMLPGYTAPKILWLKENSPTDYENSQVFLLPHDYLNYWLTGEKRMEFGDASGTALLDVRTRRWDEKLCNFIAPDLLDKLPVAESSKYPNGLLRSALAEKWGIKGNVLVSAGGGDNMMGAIGTGNVRQGIFTASLGTSGTLYAYSSSPVVDPEGEIAAFCDSTDAWLPLACTMNVTVATEKVRALFNWNHAALEAAVKSAPPGADGLLFLPYLNGERMPSLPNGKGVFHGLTMETMEPARMARSVMEGVTLGLAYGLAKFKELKVEPKEIRLIGGGSKSAIWRQICADIFGCPVVGLAAEEGAALGAAMQAASTEQCVNRNQLLLRDLTKRLVRLDETTRCEPNPKTRELYANLLLRHGEMTRKLHGAGYL